MDKFLNKLESQDVPVVIEEYNIEEIREHQELAKEAASKKKEKPAEKEKPKIQFSKKKTPDELKAMSYQERMKYFDWERQRDKEKVKARFVNHENPNVPLTFPFLKWKGDGYQTLHFEDGKVYDVERGVVNHINNNCWYPEYEHLPGGKFINVPGEQPTNMRVGKKVRRFGFQIIDTGYEDIQEDVFSPIVFVEHVSQQNLTGK